jgi:DNA-binding PadR family transcriptional regulator
MSKEQFINSQDMTSPYQPLTESTFFILLSLSPGKKHGYAIMKDVEAMSSGNIHLSTSTLYSALGRLLDRGLIERVPNDEDNSTGPGLPRKAYVLSKNGRHALEMEVSRMQGLVAAAKLRLSQEHP